MFSLQKYQRFYLYFSSSSSPLKNTLNLITISLQCAHNLGGLLPKGDHEHFDFPRRQCHFTSSQYARQWSREQIHNIHASPGDLNPWLSMKKAKTILNTQASVPVQQLIRKSRNICTEHGAEGTCGICFAVANKPSPQNSANIVIFLGLEDKVLW